MNIRKLLSFFRRHLSGNAPQGESQHNRQRGRRTEKEVEKEIGTDAQLAQSVHRSGRCLDRQDRWRLANSLTHS